MSILEIVKANLKQIINDIDCGNTEINEEQAHEILSLINKVSVPTNKYSKEQACKYLHISRATFDRYVKSGLIPQGRSEVGFKEKFWIKKDLDEAKLKIRNS